MNTRIMHHRKRTMTKKTKTLQPQTSAIVGYERILTDVVAVLESARCASGRAVNAFMTASYWQVGRRIVEWEQGGSGRAAYGEYLIDRLSADLTTRFGRGYSRRAVYQMRSFYLAYPTAPIMQSPIAQLPSDAPTAIVQSAIAQLPHARPPQFPLTWTHYVRLLSIKDADARAFYEAEALRSGWTIKQLNRQVNSLFFQRTMLSRNKAAMLTKGAKAQPEDTVTPEETLKDPYVLEFLGLKDEYSETQIEEALIRHLESFLMELGGDFAFVGRQKRLRIGDQWFRIDLLFFHRKLRCLVIIDLKTGELTHADAGQMHLYLNYATEHWANPGENPPVGLILCAAKDAAVAHYALDNLPNKVLAAEYKMQLPDTRTLAAEVSKTRRALEIRAITRGKDGRR